MMMELLLDCLRKQKAHQVPYSAVMAIDPVPENCTKLAWKWRIIERQQFSGNWDALPKVVGRQIYPTTTELFRQGHFYLNAIQSSEHFSARSTRHYGFIRD